tara:strand:- start:15 stop:269 length:255 start_codon:yes stop_codon:yes gene_type:complete
VLGFWFVVLFTQVILLRLNLTARQRLEKIRREDALEMVDRTVVIESFSRRQNVFISKRHGLWDWNRDGIPGWLLPVLRDAGLLD